MSNQSAQAQASLDGRTIAFTEAARAISHAALQGEDLPLETITRAATGVIEFILRYKLPIQNSEALKNLVKLNIRLTGFVDSIVLNAAPDERNDPSLQFLRKLAGQRATWPTMVRPGDRDFSDEKLRKLGVGCKAGLGALPLDAKRPPSLKTPINRLTLRLIETLEKIASSALYIDRQNVRARSTREESFLTLSVWGFPRKQHSELLEILDRAERYPFSKRTLRRWSGILVDYVLLVGPENFAELKSGLRKYDLLDPGQKRSKLQRDFGSALERFAARSA